MTVRSELLLSMVDAAVDREREQEAADLVGIANQFAARNTSASTMHIQARYQRRRQTVANILAVRIREEIAHPLGGEDEDNWYEALIGDLQARLGTEFDRLRIELHADMRRFLGQSAQ